MPSLYWTGMMAGPSFMDAGSTLFGVFNRVELLLAAGTLAGLLAATYVQDIPPESQRWMIALGIVLAAVVAIDTYGLTPAMIGLGAPLSWPAPLSGAPIGMDQLHGAYFALEGLKIAAGAMVLGLCIRDRH